MAGVTFLPKSHPSKTPPSNLQESPILELATKITDSVLRKCIVISGELPSLLLVGGGGGQEAGGQKKTVMEWRPEREVESDNVVRQIM